jgi:hypothetical protein
MLACALSQTVQPLAPQLEVCCHAEQPQVLQLLFTPTTAGRSCATSALPWNAGLSLRGCALRATADRFNIVCFDAKSVHIEIDDLIC